MADRGGAMGRDRGGAMGRAVGTVENGRTVHS